MFFDRLGRKSSTEQTPTHSQRRRRQLAAVSLAAALAAPNVLELRHLKAQEATPAPADAAVLAMQQQATPAALLQQGVGQYNDKQYEASVATLQQVNAEALNADQRTQLTETLAKAQSAANQRKAARAEFEMGEAALAEGKSADAVAHYKAAAENPFADEGTRRRAMEQTALAQASQKEASGDLKDLYRSAQADYKAGRLEEARGKFQQLQSAGFKAPFFNRSPSDYLDDVNAKLAKAGQPQPADTSAEQPTVAEAAPAGESAGESGVDARALYVKGHDLYDKGDWIGARQAFEAAQAAGYKPRMFEDSPAKILARMDKKEQADAAKAARLAERQQQESEAQAAREAREAARRAEADADRATEEAQQRQATAMAENSAVAQAPAAAAQETPAQPATPAEPAAPVEQAPPAVSAQPPAEPAEPAEPAPRPTAPVTATERASQDLERTAQLERIRQQQRSYEAQLLVEQARAAQGERRYAEALELYGRALELDSSNQQAAAGRQEMLTLQGRAASPDPLLRQQETQIRMAKGAINYEFNTAIQEAENAIQAGDFAASQAAVDRARVVANRRPDIFQPDEVRDFQSRIANTQQRLAQTREAAEARGTEQQTADAARREAERLRQEEQQRRETVADLIDQSQRLTADRRYAESMVVLDQILELDPNNDYARGVRPLVEDRKLFQEQREYRETFDRKWTEQMNAAEERRIPYDDILRYADNWPDIAELRDRTTAQERGVGEEDAAVQEQLDKTLPELRFDAVGFGDVVDFLRDITGTNIFVNWRALEAAGIDRTAPVTIRLRNVKFSKALQLILADVGGGTVRLAYNVDEGVITVSTDEDLSQNVVTRVHDIRDLIIDIPDFEDAPEFSLEGGGGSGGGGGGGGGSIFGDAGGGEGEDEERTREELIDEIILLITETVAPDTWRDAGGSIGAIRQLSGQLIVTQTPENQQLLLNLLEQLRETRAVQVTVEARFLTVQRNFLEDIGVDVDFVFNADGTGGQLGSDDKFSPVPVSTGGVAPIRGNDFISGVDTGAPGNLSGNQNLVAPSLGLSGGYFLDDFQVEFLLRATQAVQNTSTVTAPRLTLFNGQRAYVVVATERAYVSDLTPVVAQNAVGFDAEVEIIQSGVLLDVSATVSSDRKYVTMTLRPTLATLLELVQFPVSAVINNPGGDDDDDGGGGSDIVTGFLQQPILQITDIRTTVNVPDGGTLLLGGQTIAGEIEREQGTPILSKIPFLKRLFTNRAMSKDEQVLLILVKPTIIITREIEQESFPVLSTPTR